jgi:ABC-type multidrug transport system fused ATPase/permease subunit
MSESIPTKSLFKKISFLLSPQHKKQLMVMGGLLLIGLVFEMMGLGIIIPVLALLLSPDIVHDYPSLQPFFHFLGDPTQGQLVLIGMSGLVLVYLLKALFMIFLAWRQSKFSAEMYVYFSNTLFLGYLLQPYSFHLRRNSALLLRNIQGEVGTFNGISQSVISLLIEFSAALGIALMLLIIEPVGATVVTFFLLLSGYGFHLATKKRLLAWGRKRQMHEGEMNQHLIQGLNGVKEVKLIGKEGYFLTQFDKHNIERGKITSKQTTLQQVPRTYLELLAVMGLAALVILMMLQHKPLHLLVPTLGIFVAAAFRMIPSANRIMSLISQIRYAQPVVELLYNEFVMIENTRKELEASNTGAGLQFAHDIKVDHLVFSYFGTHTNALNDVSLTIKKGESVGLIGHSGSGKSTLVDVLLGLLTPNSGGIIVDGHDIQAGIRNWQSKIGYVPQTIYLVDNTLRSNVAFGVPPEEVDEDAVVRAIKAAQLDEYVAGLPEGLDTYVGERGVRLSGGQRQRIGIARALYNDPEVLVLDEATSALDTTTESGVMEAVTALHGQKTLIIVAHRLSTVENCDRLYRLEKGKIIAQGAPVEMIKVK